MKKLLLALSFIMLVGCEEEYDNMRKAKDDEKELAAYVPELWYASNWSKYSYKLETHLLCDKKMNIVYMYITSAPHQAGITPYYKADGHIMRCDELGK